MADRAFLDSNILVYLFAADAPSKRDVVADLVLSHPAEGNLVISTQVMQECYAVLTGKFRRAVSGKAALEALRRMRQMEVVQVDPDLILEAAERSIRDGIHFWDAIIVESALKAGCRQLLSEDFQAGREFGTLRVVNPFPGVG